MSHSITRRAFAAAFPLAGLSAALAEGAAKPAPALTIGVATLGFPDSTNRQLAQELPQQGVAVRRERGIEPSHGLGYSRRRPSPRQLQPPR